jgi:hypothetical protein
MRKRIMWRGFAAMLAMGLSSLCSAAEIGDFAGTWVFDKGRSTDIEKAVETCVAKTNFVTRSVARPRLKKTNKPFESVAIASDASSVSVVYGQKGMTISSPPDGKVVPWTREDGVVFQVSHQIAGERLIEIFRGEDGQKRTDFTVSADRSSLSLDVTVSSPRLPEPLVYKLVYRKKT